MGTKLKQILTVQFYHRRCAWPGFTPDLLSIVLVVATQAKGDVLIHQKMFESRLFFVDKLIDMGKIMLCDPHRAVVMGHDFQSQLKATMSSPDIRAGISLLIAALSAKGTSTIQNIEQIDRGYERIDERLRAIELILFVLGKK
jgi:UDP-N-acetylglucosamine 1-carboxyvinyltransferase